MNKFFSYSACRTKLLMVFLRLFLALSSFFTFTFATFLLRVEVKEDVDESLLKVWLVS